MLETTFDPSKEADPGLALTQAIRGLPVGSRLRLSNGTVVKSVGVKHGATLARRFAVTKDGQVLQYNQTTYSTISTAEEAAKVALGVGQ